jgi:hypothetical protein
MLAVTQLGATEQISVDQCVEQTGMSPEQCNLLLLQIGAQPSIYYLIAKSALLKYGAKACAEALEKQTGVPKKIGFAACDYAIRKIWEAGAKAMLYGGPEWRSLYAGGGYEGIHWRQCASWEDLQPGEHWNRTLKQCVLNVAILQKKGEPQVVVYVPCEHLPNDASNLVCRDRDGVHRTVGQKQPTCSSGWFGKRLANWWPSQFEQTPWQSPTPTPSPFSHLRPRVMTTATAVRLEPTTTTTPATPTQYPAGTVAMKTERGTWLVAVPTSALSGGEGPSYSTQEVTDDPSKRGARIVRPWLFEYMTGKRSWYETPPAWAGFGLLSLGLLGGAWLYKRNR